MVKGMYSDLLLALKLALPIIWIQQNDNIKTHALLRLLDAYMS